MVVQYPWFLFVDYYFYPIVFRKNICLIVKKKLSILGLLPNVWSVPENAPSADEKKVYSIAVDWSIPRVLSQFELWHSVPTVTHCWFSLGMICPLRGPRLKFVSLVLIVSALYIWGCFIFECMFIYSCCDLFLNWSFYH